VIAATEIRWYDASDVPWVHQLVDLVAASLGAPWRVVLERIEHADLDAHPARVTAIVRALRRTIGGRAERSRVARRLRALVLGHPALDRDTRDARLGAVGAVLGLPPGEIESLLWADLALEQPVALPSGRPRELALIATANLDRIQRAVRRARSIRIAVWDEANPLVRMVARYGLVARIARGASGETVFEVAGPLAMFHATTVYGRALAQLVPLLADHRRFTLDVACELDGIERALHVEPPVLLPAVVTRRRAPSVADRLAADLLSSGHQIEREPVALAAGDDLLFPDLAIEHAGQQWLVEIVGFSTAEYLAHKRERYRAAGIERVVLCVDEDRRVGEVAGDEIGAHVVASRPDERGVIAFRRRVGIDVLIECLDGARR